VTIQNYKVINCRPTTTTYNQTDGVDFDESTNGTLYNAFLYTGDDGMAPKNEDSNGTINTKNIMHQHIVVYNNSVGCKIGTKSMGQSMDGITFKDIDVVKAGRAMTIEAYDTAVVSNTTFEDIRVEAADSMLINLALDVPPTWRTAADTGVYKDTYFTNVSSDVKKVISLHGKSSSVNITGVHFKNFTRRSPARATSRISLFSERVAVASGCAAYFGSATPYECGPTLHFVPLCFLHAITSQTDSDASWDINSYVSVTHQYHYLGHTRRMSAGGEDQQGCRPYSQH
jgi:hypothetical protein